MQAQVGHSHLQGVQLMLLPDMAVLTHAQSCLAPSFKAFRSRQPGWHETPPYNLQVAQTCYLTSHFSKCMLQIQTNMLNRSLPSKCYKPKQACVPLRQARKRGAAREASTVRTECSRALSAMVVASATVMGAPPELVRMPASMSCG